MARLVINQALRDAVPPSALAALEHDAGEDGQLRLEAESVRGLLRLLEARYPGLRSRLEQGIAVAIDGDIHADALLEPLTADSEVCFVPAIEGG